MAIERRNNIRPAEENPKFERNLRAIRNLLWITYALILVVVCTMGFELKDPQLEILFDTLFIFIILFAYGLDRVYSILKGLK